MKYSKKAYIFSFVSIMFCIACTQDNKNSDMIMLDKIKEPSPIHVFFSVLQKKIIEQAINKKQQICFEISHDSSIKTRTLQVRIREGGIFICNNLNKGTITKTGNWSDIFDEEKPIKEIFIWPADAIKSFKIIAGNKIITVK